MSAFVLFSSPRHGTNYFCRVLNKIENSVNFTMSYELMSNHFETIEYCWQRFKTSFADHNINLTDKQIKEAIELRAKDIKSYYDLVFDTNEQLAKLQNTKWSGFKIFPGQLKYSYEDTVYSIDLDYIISKVDKVIFLNRCNIEFIHSYLQALATNSFGLQERNVKIDVSKLEQHFEGGYKTMEQEAYKLFKMKYETYPLLIDVCKKQNKEMLILDYNDFALDGWQRISSFLKTPIYTKFYPFSKNIYNYEEFYKLYPNIKKIAEEFKIDV